MFLENGVAQGLGTIAAGLIGSLAAEINTTKLINAKVNAARIEREFQQEENSKYRRNQIDKTLLRYQKLKEREIYKHYLKKLEKISNAPLSIIPQQLCDQENGRYTLGVFLIKACKFSVFLSHWESVFNNAAAQLGQFVNGYFPDGTLRFLSEHALVTRKPESKYNCEGLRNSLTEVLHRVVPYIIFSCEVNYDVNRSSADKHVYTLTVGYSADIKPNEESPSRPNVSYLIQNQVITLFSEHSGGNPTLSKESKQKLLEWENYISALLRFITGYNYDEFSYINYGAPPVYPTVVLKEYETYNRRQNNRIAADPEFYYSDIVDTFSVLYSELHTKYLKSPYNLSRLDYSERTLKALQPLADSFPQLKPYRDALEECRANTSYIRNIFSGDDETELQNAIEACRQKAEEANDVLSQYNLGIYYASILKFEEAVKWLRKAAEQGDCQSQYMLAVCLLKDNYTAQDGSEAIEWLKKAAAPENKFAEAQFYLGICYAIGQGTEINRAEAIKYLTSAADNDLAEAQFYLGNLYSAEQTNGEISSKAYEYYLKAAEQGHTDAQFNLAICLFDGLGVESDDAKACEWCVKAAEQGHEEAKLKLAVCLLNGRGVKPNPARAFTLFKELADKGIAAAQFAIGYLYHTGQGVQRDYKEALSFYEKAAEQNYADAQFNLGVCHNNGEGVKQDYGAAFRYYEKAASQDHAAAQCNLGACYYYGHGVPANREEAFKWFSKSAKQNFPEAQLYLGEYCFDKEEYYEALQHFEAAAENGNKKADYWLGNCYYKYKDYDKAFEYYQKAVQTDRGQALFRLGYCYFKGRGTQENPIRGEECLSEAVRNLKSASESAAAKGLEVSKAIQTSLKDAEYWLKICQQARQNRERNVSEQPSAPEFSPRSE